MVSVSRPLFEVHRHKGLSHKTEVRLIACGRLLGVHMYSDLVRSAQFGADLVRADTTLKRPNEIDDATLLVTVEGGDKFAAWTEL